MAGVEFNPLDPTAASSTDSGDAQGSVSGLVEPEVVPAQESNDPAPHTLPEVTVAQEPTPKDNEPSPEDRSAKFDEWAKRFEAMSQRDAELRAREQMLKQYEQKLQQASELERLAKESPLQALQRLGLDVDTVLKSHLNGGAPDPLSKVKELEERTKQMEAAFTQRIEQEKLQRIGERWENEFQSLYNSDEYAIVRDWGDADQTIREFVAKHYQQTQELLPPKQQLDIMKKELLARLEKTRTYVSPVEPAKAKAAAAPKSNQGAKTLTPNLANTPTRYAPWDDEIAEMQRLTAKHLG